MKDNSVKLIYISNRVNLNSSVKVIIFYIQNFNFYINLQENLQNLIILIGTLPFRFRL